MRTRTSGGVGGAGVSPAPTRLWGTGCRAAEASMRHQFLAGLDERADRRDLPAGVLLRRTRLELERHEALIAYDPSVVTGLDHVGLTGPKLHFRAIVMSHGQPARLNDADMPRLATRRAGDRLYALRPLPAGLERHASDTRTARMDHVHPRLLRSPRLVGGIEIERLHTSHASLLPVANPCSKVHSTRLLHSAGPPR